MIMSGEICAAAEVDLRITGVGVSKPGQNLTDRQKIYGDWQYEWGRADQRNFDTRACRKKFATSALGKLRGHD